MGSSSQVGVECSKTKLLGVGEGATPCGAPRTRSQEVPALQVLDSLVDCRPAFPHPSRELRQRAGSWRALTRDSVPRWLGSEAYAGITGLGIWKPAIPWCQSAGLILM